MAASSSSSSQGSAPGLLGKRKLTPGDLIEYSLEDLIERDFKKFKNKLSDFSNGAKLPIPRGRLENADWTTTKDLLIDAYGEEGALDVTTEVLTLIHLMGPANDLRDRRAQNATLKKTTHNNRLADFIKEYRTSVTETFHKMKEYNSRMGEAVIIQKRYIKLLMRKGGQNKEDKEQEIRRSGRRDLRITEKRSSEESSPITIQGLFDPDEDDFPPKIVVLQGPAGIGKTMTSKKILLDWAAGHLYQDKFDLAFYLSCREVNTITGNTNLVGLLSRCCRLPCSDDLLSILKDPQSHRRLLIIVDGFDELRWTREKDRHDPGVSADGFDEPRWTWEKEAEDRHDPEVFADVSEKTHQEILLKRLLSKQILQQSSLIITTRSLALDKLNTFMDDPHYVEVLGFTREDCDEYVHKFFGNGEDADKVLSIIKDNDIVYTMCAVPVTCWIVCTVMKQEVKKDLGLMRCHTMTSIYLLYLEVLLTHHIKKVQPGRRTPEVVRTCLKKLCALANEGVLNQQILFEDGDLKRHGLSLSEVESVFLNENIFHWDVRTQTCYSFIHLSVQEFLAALHYALDYSFVKRFSLPKICKGNSLSGLSPDFSHLTLAVQFLYGLLNKNLVKTFSESTRIKISLRAKSKMRDWAWSHTIWDSPTYMLFCLYETQDEDFIRSVIWSSSSFRLIGSNSGHLWMDCSYSKQLSYFLTALKAENFKTLCFECLTVDAKCQEELSPILHRCQEVSFQEIMFHRRYSKSMLEIFRKYMVDTLEPEDLSFLINPESKIQELSMRKCGVTLRCCDVLYSVLVTNRFLTNLDLYANNLQNSGIKRLCEGLRDPRCALQTLSLEDCGLSSLCCEDFRSILITNRSLIKLNLSMNDLRDCGVRMLCEGLRHPHCILQCLSLKDCRLTGRSCQELHSVLLISRSLTELILTGNLLQDWGIKLLCAGMSHADCTLQDLTVIACDGTLSCCDDICSLITTKQSTIGMWASVHVDDKIAASEVERYYNMLQRLGIGIIKGNKSWTIFFGRS